MLKRGLWFASAHNLLFLGTVGANIEIQASGHNRGRAVSVNVKAASPASNPPVRDMEKDLREKWSVWLSFLTATRSSRCLKPAPAAEPAFTPQRLQLDEA